MDNNIFEKYPELAKYDPEENQYDMDRPPIDDIELPDLIRFEIVFKVDGILFYCFTEGVNLIEALGNFFAEHPHITYNEIVEHFEV